MKNLVFYLFGIVSLAVIIIVISSSYKGGKKYELNETEAELLEKIVNKEQFITPEEFAGKLLASEKGFILIDIRNSHNYMADHIDGAVNIPFQQILDEKWEYVFEDSSTLKILYCNLDIYANEAWMLLDQLGYRNLKVLEGGFDFWKEQMKSNYKARSGGAYDETPAYNYKIEVKNAGDGSAPSSQQNNAGQVQFSVKKKKGPSGGCG